METKIAECDKSVLSSLCARGRPVRGRSVKNVRSVIHKPRFQCKQCDSTYDSFLKLRKHKLSEHSKSFNSSQHSLVSIKHSTRNNSFSDEELLCEDLTLESLPGDISTKNQLEMEKVSTS